MIAVDKPMLAFATDRYYAADLTEELMAEFAQDGGKSLFHAAFEALPDAACILAPVDHETSERDWRYLASNAALRDLLGVETLTGDSVRQHFPKQADHWSAVFSRVLETARPETLIRETHDRSHVHEICLTLLSEGGSPAVLCRIRDITAEHLARVRSREADVRYKLLFDAIDEGFCIIDLIFDEAGRGVDYRMVEANPAFVAHTGLDDPVGKRVRELQPDIEDHWPETYGRIATSGIAERFESQSLALGRWFDVFAFPIGEKVPYQVGILFEDVGARKQMEIALRHSESRLKSLIEASSDLIFRMSPDGAEMQQVGGKDLLGVGDQASDWIAQFVPEIDRDTLRQVWPSHADARRSRSITDPAARRTIGWLSTRAIPVMAIDGAITNGSAWRPTSPAAATFATSLPGARRCCGWRARSARSGCGTGTWRRRAGLVGRELRSAGLRAGAVVRATPYGPIASTRRIALRRSGGATGDDDRRGIREEYRSLPTAK